jgi:hypothetical protein
MYTIYILSHTGVFMRNFILGTVFGIIVATVGFSGIAKLLDKGVEKTKEIAVEGTK